MKMSEKIQQLEGYLSSIILGEFPGLDLSNVEPGHLGVRYSMIYEYDKDIEELKLDVKPILGDYSPEWLGPVLNMCLTQMGWTMNDDPIGFLKHFQKSMDTFLEQRVGDIYLHIPLHDKMFMYHLPLGCALHLLPLDVLKKLKSSRGHEFCREAIKEMANRERHST